MTEHYKTLLTQYKQWLKVLGYATRTKECYTREIGLFFDWLIYNNINQISLLNTAHIYQYFNHLQQTISTHTSKPLSFSQLNNSFIAIDKLCQCLYQLGMVNAPSPTNYRIYRAKNENFEVLTQAEVKALYRSIEDTFEEFTFKKRTVRQSVLRLVLDLCYGCGLRKSELFNLKLKDVLFDQSSLHIRQSKNYKDRYVPMSASVLKNTKDFVYNHRREFTKRPTMLYPHSKEHININLNILVKHCPKETLKYKRVFPHLLRYSIATHLLLNGMDIEHISRFLGHTSLEATQIYTHITHKQFS